MPLTAEVTPLEENRVRLEVAVPGDEVQRRMERAIRRLGREVRVPGFRPGKAPAEVVVQRVGHDAVVQEMLKSSLGDWYSEAVAETGIVPIDDPDLDLEGVPDEGELTFTATVDVRPTATLGDYAGIEVGRADAEVPAGALDEQLERLREQAARLQVVERASRTGDFVVIDFDGSVDGKRMKNATARDYLVELGGGRLVPEFDILTQPAQQQFRLILRQFAVNECGYLRFYCIVHRFPPNYRTRFPTFFPIASRALKILDRTVPTGQSIVCAISS